ncbi:MAG: CoA transferase [Deltaproteobacteria bacterium]|nr:CoA transferase [Deltaproteobacteria bacterium]
MGKKALSGVKVVEYANNIGAPYCSKLMADMGAEVIKIEKPVVGDEARRRGPFLGDVPHPEKSVIFCYVNSNKLSVTLDIEKPEGREIFKRLAGEADILIKEGLPEEFERLGLGYRDLKEINPRLIMASFTPYGESGPYRNYKAYPLNLSHVCGIGNQYPLPSPDLSREPTKLGGNCQEYHPGVMAITAILAALFWQRKTNKGQYIEMSLQDMQLCFAKTENAVYAVYGKTMTRMSENLQKFPLAVVPCKDGYVNTMILQDVEWGRFVELMGSPEWSKEEWTKSIMTRIPHMPMVNSHIVDWMKNQTKAEIVDKAQKARCPVGPVNTAKDIVESEQFHSRGFFAEVQHPVMGKFKFPGRPFLCSETPCSYESPAPVLGQDNDMIYRERLGYGDADLARLKEKRII